MSHSPTKTELKKLLAHVNRAEDRWEAAYEKERKASLELKRARAAFRNMLKPRRAEKGKVGR